jgi:transposase
MKKVNTKAQRMGAIVGLDLSDKKANYAVLSWRGDVLEEGIISLTRAGLQGLFSGRRCRVAVEAGTHSPWVSRELSSLGQEVIVANPRQLPLIYRSRRKNDRLDAIALARLARLDPALLAPVRHRSESAQADLALLRSRDQLVAVRTSLINHVRGSVKAMGGRLPKSSAEAFAGKVREAIPEALLPALAPIIESIAQLTDQIRGYDKEVERLAQESYPETRLLRQVNGVGPLTSLAFVLTLEDPRRFEVSRDVGAYLGLTPRQRDTGESHPQLHITKAGDIFLRKLLVQCAHYILGPFGKDCELRRWGLKLAGETSKDQKKRAMPAVARKLAVLLHQLWSSAEVYEPLREVNAAA